MTRAPRSRRALPIALLAAFAGSLLPATALGTSGGGAFTTTGRTVAAQHEAHGASGSQPSYGAQLVACRRSPRIDGRVAIVGTTMRPIAGSKKLAVQINLYQRAIGGRWTLRNDVPGLGAWTSPSDPAIGSRPGDVFKYRQAVARLVVPFAYRFRVGFRWLDDNGAVVREATATTHPCHEPDLRPDLTIAGVLTHISARQPGVVRYRVSVRNDGRTPARGVALAATLPGDATTGTHSAQAGRIGPGQTVDVTFSGPGCAADGTAGPSFTVDPTNAIEESDETDNALALACPVP